MALPIIVMAITAPVRPHRRAAIIMAAMVMDTTTDGNEKAAF